MKLKVRFGALVAATVVAVAITAAPANAASTKPAIPSLSSLGAYCKQIKDPKLAAVCTDLTSGKRINIQSLLAQLGGKTGGLNLSSLLGQLGGGSLGGLGGLSGLSGLGGLNLSGLLAGLKP